jgi:hypothetical protein
VCVLSSEISTHGCLVGYHGWTVGRHHSNCSGKTRSSSPALSTRSAAAWRRRAAHGRRRRAARGRIAYSRSIAIVTLNAAPGVAWPRGAGPRRRRRVLGDVWRLPPLLGSTSPRNLSRGPPRRRCGPRRRASTQRGRPGPGAVDWGKRSG